MAEVPVLVRRNRDDVHHVFISVLPAHADLSNEADLQVPIMEHAVIVTLVATDELVELALVVLEAANDLAAFSIIPKYLSGAIIAPDQFYPFISLSNLSQSTFPSNLEWSSI